MAHSLTRPRTHLVQAALPDAPGALAAGGAVDDDDLRYRQYMRYMECRQYNSTAVP